MGNTESVLQECGCTTRNVTTSGSNDAAEGPVGPDVELNRRKTSRQNPATFRRGKSKDRDKGKNRRKKKKRTPSSQEKRKKKLQKPRLNAIEIFPKINFDYAGGTNADEEQVIDRISKGKLGEIQKTFSQRTIRINASNQCGYTALYTACAFGKRDIVKLLIANKANVSYINTKSAQERGHEYEVQIQTKDKKNTSQSGVGVSTLFMASQIDEPMTIDLLLAGNADVNKGRMEDDVSPLYIACMKKLFGNVKSLVTGKASLNQKASGINSATPLYIASQIGALKIVKYLVEKKSEINQMTNVGVTPLFIACHQGHRRNQHCIVKTLVENQADINLSYQTNSEKLTPLALITGMLSRDTKETNKVRYQRIKAILENPSQELRSISSQKV